MKKCATHMDNNAVGRPTSYSLELAEKICDVISSSDATIAAVCKLPGMPDRSQIFRWLARHTEFRDLYIRAREFQTELLYDDMNDIVQAPFEETDVFDKLGNFVGTKVDPVLAMAEVQRRKLQVDIIKFKLMKLQARRFGDNKNVNVDVNVKHNVTGEQYQKLLQTAAAAPQIEAPEVYEEAEILHDEPDDIDMSAEDFDNLVDPEDDDDLG